MKRHETMPPPHSSSSARWTADVTRACSSGNADHVHAVLSATPGLANTAADFAPRPASRPETKFERRGLKLGHGVWDLVFRRRPDKRVSQDVS